MANTFVSPSTMPMDTSKARTCAISPCSNISKTDTQRKWKVTPLISFTSISSSHLKCPKDKGFLKDRRGSNFMSISADFLCSTEAGSKKTNLPDCFEVRRRLSMGVVSQRMRLKSRNPYKTFDALVLTHE